MSGRDRSKMQGFDHASAPLEPHTLTMVERARAITFDVEGPHDRTALRIHDGNDDFGRGRRKGSQIAGIRRYVIRYDGSARENSPAGQALGDRETGWAGTPPPLHAKTRTSSAPTSYSPTHRCDVAMRMAPAIRRARSFRSPVSSAIARIPARSAVSSTMMKLAIVEAHSGPVGRSG
jgi:hypothetical protein